MDRNTRPMSETMAQKESEVTSRTRGQLSDLADELAVHELYLDACGAWRLLAVVAAPLLIALVTEVAWLTALCGMVLALMYYPLLRGWGYTALAMVLGVLPAYAYLELSAPANWLAFAAAFVGFFAAIYVVERLRTIRALRSYLAERDRNADSSEQTDRVRRGNRLGR